MNINKKIKPSSPLPHKTNSTTPDTGSSTSDSNLERFKLWLGGGIALLVLGFLWTGFNGGGIGCWPSKKFKVRQIHHLTGIGQKYGPLTIRGIQYVKDDKVAVWDDANEKVLLLDFEGNFVDSWNRRDLAPNNPKLKKKWDDSLARGNAYGLNIQSIFNEGFPYSRALDSKKKRLYTADYDHWCVKITDSNEKTLGSIPLKDRPVALALDDKGRLFVSFRNHYFLQVFSASSGRFLGDVQVENPDPNMTYLDVWSLFVTDNDLLVAADRYSIWIYQILSK